MQPSSCMEDIKLTLNPNEANVLIQVMDIATKAGGLKVAEATLHFTKKLQAAGVPVQQPEAEGEGEGDEA